MQQPDYRQKCLLCRGWMRFNPSATAPRQRMYPPHASLCTDCHQTPQGQARCQTCSMRKWLERSCCYDWWEGLTEAQRKYVHWYFRDISAMPDFSFHSSVSDHLAEVRDFQPPEISENLALLPAPFITDDLCPIEDLFPHSFLYQKRILIDYQLRQQELDYYDRKEGSNLQ